jgi:hypothetical protein
MNLAYAALDHLSLFTVPSSRQYLCNPLTLCTKQAQELFMQLNLLAGQLYLGSYAEYRALCRYLGLLASAGAAPTGFGDSSGGGGGGGGGDEGALAVAAATEADEERSESGGSRNGAAVRADGFVGGAGCLFPASPVAFLSALIMRIRRDGQDIGRTHLGKVLAGDLLRESDFVSG